MDKEDRVLMLFWQLYNGRAVNRNSFCFETGIDSRTFDRDIADIRNFLADIYSGQELIFDRRTHTYRISGIVQQALSEVELTAVITILIGAKALRADELKGLTAALGQATESVNPEIKKELARMLGQYTEDESHSAILKMQWDLFQCIKKRLLIEMQYMNRSGSRDTQRVIPLELYFENQHFFLKAVCMHGNRNPEIYLVDRIAEFKVIRGLNAKEEKLYFEGFRGESVN